MSTTGLQDQLTLTTANAISIPTLDDRPPTKAGEKRDAPSAQASTTLPPMD
jgi:hypothetical protein